MNKEERKGSFKLPEIILGGQDGLVNVLGIILGVAAATSDTSIVIVAGMAATFAESISMAAVAYTSQLAEVDYYQSKYENEEKEIEKTPAAEKEEVRTIYAKLGFEGQLLDQVVNKITSNRKVWLKVMMTQELGLEPIDRKEVLPKAILVGVSALAGSLLPLAPFFLLPIKTAIAFSLIVSSCTLFAVGYYKAHKTLGRQLVKQGFEMMLIGMLSAFAGYFIGVLFKV